MKRILEIVPHFGFARSFLGYRMKLFAEDGYRMYLASSPDEELPSFAEENRFEYMATEMPRVPSLWKDTVAVIRICRYVRRENIECVVGHADKGKLLAVICGFLTGRKIVLFAHGTSFETRKGLSRKLFVALDRVESKFASRVICVSPFLKELRLNLGIDRPGKSYVPGKGSCCGIDVNGKFNPGNVSVDKQTELRKSLGLNETDFVLGFCGRIVRDKGIEELVEAFELFKKQVNGRVKLLVVGPWDIRDGIKSSVRDIMAGDDDIILCGDVDDNIELYYSIMSLFVLPTHRDGLGLSLLEAGAMEIPVLTTGFTGSRDTIIPGETGDCVTLDPQNVCAAMFSLYCSPERLAKYGKAGRKWVRDNFERTAVCRSIKECFDSMS